jgi:transcriptional regulator with XRE-family HTH domain
MFKDNLRELREMRKMSQTELANETGLVPSAICHFECGRREPNMHNLIKLSKALKVTTDSLLFDEAAKQALKGA